MRVILCVFEFKQSDRAQLAGLAGLTVLVMIMISVKRLDLQGRNTRQEFESIKDVLEASTMEMVRSCCFCPACLKLSSSPPRTKPL